MEIISGLIVGAIVCFFFRDSGGSFDLSNVSGSILFRIVSFIIIVGLMVSVVFLVLSQLTNMVSFLNFRFN